MVADNPNLPPPPPRETVDPKPVDPKLAAEALLHKLWSKAVGTPGYEKEDWKRFQLMIEKLSK